MTQKKNSDPKANLSGGVAAAGGMNFQANVSALVSVHMLTATPLGWLEGLTEDCPKTVSAETGGPGDDIAIEFQDGIKAEVQVKKGMRKGAKFWTAVDDLIAGIGSGKIDFGLLVVCPQSSGTIRDKFAKALVRIGDGREDGASSEQVELAKRITSHGYDPKRIASVLRIRTIAALVADDDAVGAAKARLGYVYETTSITTAWNALVLDANRMIELKGRRTIANLVRYLGASGIHPDPQRASSASLIATMLANTLASSDTFEVLGMPKSLPLDTAWIDLRVEVRDDASSVDVGPEKALEEYYKHGQVERAYLSDAIVATTIGQFRRHCVVVGGPGGGKSLLTKKLARDFSQSGIPCLRVNLRQLASRIKSQGCSVVEGIFSLGLADTGLSETMLKDAALSELVLLCDGLDETGNHQKSIAEALKAYANCNRAHRVIVTTRPIGYVSTTLMEWRHYTLHTPALDDLAENVATLVRVATDRDDDDLLDEINVYLGPKSVREAVARTPLLIGFVASLFLRKKPASETKVDLHEQIFAMIDEETTPRKARIAALGSEVRAAVLDHLGWIAVSDQTTSLDDMKERCAERLATELGVPKLRASNTTGEAIAYWEEAGMIEPLSSGDVTLLAFIHKSCAEYAAARYLGSLDADTCRSFMTENFDAPNWTEVMDFSTRTSVAKILAEVSLASAAKADAPLTHIERGLYAVSKGLMDKQDPHVVALVDSLVAQLESAENRPRAYELGGLLLRHPVEAYPRIVALAEEMSQSSRRWQRLIGWSLRLKAAMVPTAVLREAYVDLIADAKQSGYLMRPNNFFFGDRPDHRLLESFIVSALSHLMETLDEADCEELISQLHDSGFQITMRLAIKLEDLFGVEKRKRLRELLLGTTFRDSLRSFDFGSNDRGALKFEQDMIFSVFVKDRTSNAGESDVGDMVAMSALMTACGVWKGAPYEVRYWEDAENIDHAQNAFRLAAKALGLSSERLAADALAAKRASETHTHYSQFIRVYAALPNVDPPEFDWSLIQPKDVDLVAFEAGMHQGPNWLRVLFAQLVDAVITSTDAREQLAERLLENGRGTTLHIAAAFAAELPDGRGNALIGSRLSDGVVYGSRHLFDDLARRQVAIDTDDMIAGLKSGLLSKRPDSAKAAATWLRDTLPDDAKALIPLIREALDHWKKTEKPYPKKSGAVPTSPRKELLEALIGIELLSVAELLVFMNDDRSDVKDVAKAAFINCVQSDRILQRRLPSLFKSGTLKMDFHQVLNRPDMELEDDVWLGIVKEMVDSESNIRRLAPRLITENFPDLAEARDILHRLKNDADADVAEAAKAASKSIE